MTPAVLDVPMVRGSGGDYAKLGFQLVDSSSNAVPLQGTTCTLVMSRTLDAQGGKGTRTFSTDGTGSGKGTLLLDADGVTVWWVPTQDDTLSIAIGSSTRYSLTVAFPNGSVGPYIRGALIGEDAS